MILKSRLYQPGDAEKIYSFFSDNIPYLRDDAYWIWINRLWSEEDAIIAIAENELNEIVGHYAIAKRTFTDGEKEFKVGLGFHALIHPDYRSKLSIFEVASIAYEEAARQNFHFIYGFPNKNYRLIQEKIERWKKIALFRAAEKSTSVAPEGYRFKYDWREIKADDFSLLFDVHSLLEKNIRMSFQFKRTLPEIVNRYINVPQQPYRCFGLYHEETLAAFVVTKIYRDDCTSCHIIDMILADHNNEREILLDFEVKFSTLADKIVLWESLFQDPSILSIAGYEMTGHDTFFGIKVLNENIVNLHSNLFEFSQWRLAMGDSDAY